LFYKNKLEQKRVEELIVAEKIDLEHVINSTANYTGESLILPFYVLPEQAGHFKLFSNLNAELWGLDRTLKKVIKLKETFGVKNTIPDKRISDAGIMSLSSFSKTVGLG